MANDDSKTTVQTASHDLPRQDLLGFFAHPGTLEEYLAFSKYSIEQSQPQTVLYHNLHSLYSYFTDKKLREHYQNSTILVDGMPVVWLMQILRKPVSRSHRITYVDFIMPLMELARDNDWTVFHVGQQAAVQQAALDIIRRDTPGIKIEGHDGYFDQSRRCQNASSMDGKNGLGMEL